MEKHYFYYGSQAIEYERPKVPEIVRKQGVEASVAGSKRTLLLQPSIMKVVMANVRD